MLVAEPVQAPGGRRAWLSAIVHEWTRRL